MAATGLLDDVAAGAERRARQVALVVACAFFMENLDGTVIATALPRMAQAFGTTPIALGVGITAYLLAVSVFIPASGWAADRFGARRVFGGAIAVFTIASALCASANGLWAFTAARVLQGAGGAMMVPVGRSVVLRMTAKSQLMNAMSIIIWPGLVAPVIGPPLGGFLTTYAGWRWIFLLNLPLGAAGLVLVARLFPAAREAAPRQFDILGFVLSGVALPCLMYGVVLVGQPGAGGRVSLAVLLAAAVFGFLAVRHMRRVASPLLDLRLLRLPGFAMAVWGGSASRMAIGAVPFLVPLLLQVGFGLNAFRAGLLMLAGAAGNLGMKALTTPVLRRFGFRTVLAVNGVLASLSVAACAALSLATPYAVIVAVLFAGGLCRSLQFTALNTLQFDGVPGPQMSGASTLASMVQQMALGMGVALGAVALHVSVVLRGATAPALTDFRAAFLMVAAVGLFGAVHALCLQNTIGSEISSQK